MDRDRAPTGGGRFALRRLPGAVEKTGPVAPLAREAEGLAAAAALGHVAPLIEHSPGRLVTGLMPGSPREPLRMSPAEARMLGARLRALHDHRRSGAGEVPGEDRPARSLGEYARRRRAAIGARLGRRAGVAAGLLDPGVPECCDADGPFALIHGDLVAANIVWGPGGPALVDLEFWRMGDPAEDLAYLIAVNGLDEPTARTVLDGYGRHEVATRAAGWRGPLLLEAALWYLDHREHRDAARLRARADALAAAG